MEGLGARNEFVRCVREKGWRGQGPWVNDSDLVRDSGSGQVQGTFGHTREKAGGFLALRLSLDSSPEIYAWIGDCFDDSIGSNRGGSRRVEGWMLFKISCATTTSRWESRRSNQRAQKIGDDEGRCLGQLRGQERPGGARSATRNLGLHALAQFQRSWETGWVILGTEAVVGGAGPAGKPLRWSKTCSVVFLGAVGSRTSVAWCCAVLLLCFGDAGSAMSSPSSGCVESSFQCSSCTALRDHSNVVVTLAIDGCGRLWDDMDKGFPSCFPGRCTGSGSIRCATVSAAHEPGPISPISSCRGKQSVEPNSIAMFTPEMVPAIVSSWAKVQVYSPPGRSAVAGERDTNTVSCAVT
ncbi:hypothetical protein BGZ60DRAFT_435569 [Tricladium varicosporioides]|nr:hypothetical protein BGZ60DRAFT_435569 [Hymenoscyphus varicosporioides]